MTALRVLIAAGGTAGHVFPGIALADELRDVFGADVRFLGRREGQEARLVPDAGYPLLEVRARPFSRTLSPKTIAAPLSALLAARRARGVVAGADVVVGMGGFVSVPVVLAARRERTPLVVHEQNGVPGLANRLAARWARVVALSFEEASRRLPRRARIVVTGNPVRGRMLGVREKRETLAAEALETFGLEAGRRTIAVFGGSQGAVHLNRVAIGAAHVLRGRQDLQLLLITGPAHHAETLARLPRDEALVVAAEPFVDRMELVYALANLAVARAGASTIAELSVCGVPSILVPYPYATGRHQEVNARAVQRSGGASILLDEELSPEALAGRIVAIVDHAERLGAMEAGVLSFARPGAAKELAGLVAAEAGA